MGKAGAGKFDLRQAHRPRYSALWADPAAVFRYRVSGTSRPYEDGGVLFENVDERGNITVVIDNLEKDGLVERAPFPKDRRATTIRLTSKGEKLFKDIFSQHAQFVTKIASVLNEEEQIQLSALLKKLGMALQEKF